MPDAPAAGIRVRVRLFAIQRELVGAREVELDLVAGATIEDAWAALVDRHPALAPGRTAVRFALDGDYADPSATIPDRAELAIVPPVSGGADGPAAPDDDGARILELRAEPLAVDIVARLSARLMTDADGAIVGFVGRTRQSPGTPAPGQEGTAARFAGRAVVSLEYEAHASMAVRILAEIADEIAARFGVTRVAIVHRTGEVPLGEASVAVVTVAAHRDAAFAAARYAIDETKARTPIWKAEHFADGHVWIGEPARTGPADTPTGT
jgi:molybdopterin synthase catalytic subunit